MVLIYKSWVSLNMSFLDDSKPRFRNRNPSNNWKHWSYVCENEKNTNKYYVANWYFLVNIHVYSFLYGTDSWTMEKRIMQRLVVFEMWIFCRLLKILWTRQLTTDNVIRVMETDREPLYHVTRCKISNMGHTYRETNCQLLRVMEAKI